MYLPAPQIYQQVGVVVGRVAEETGARWQPFFNLKRELLSAAHTTLGKLFKAGRWYHSCP